MGSSSLEKAVLTTVAYTAQFQYPLTMAEIWSRLVARVTSDDPSWFVSSAITPQIIKRTLRNLVQQGSLEQHEPYYAWPGSISTIQLRQSRAKVATEKWLEVEELVTQARQVPWIEAIFVTGSLAMHNTDEEADSDFMIITTPRRLWLVRLWMTWYAWRKGKRRSWHGEERRSWCFNLWLSRGELSIFAQEPSLYIAYELFQAKCVFDRGGVQAQLQSDNQWLKHFLPLAKWSRGVGSKFGQGGVWWGWPLDLLDALAYQVQLIYMKRHITRERVSRDWAFFHPRNTEAGIMKGLRARHVK